MCDKLDKIEKQQEITHCMPAAKFETKRKCQICGEESLAKITGSWHCSPRCPKIARKRRKDEERRNLGLEEVVKGIPKDQDHIKVSEAYALFGISRDTLFSRPYPADRNFCVCARERN